METSPLIKIHDLWKVYPGPDGEVAALGGIRLEVHAGSYVAIMGPSGSGKSTLLGILGCLDPPSRGSYLLDGTPVEQLTDDGMAVIRNSKIGFVFQAFHLLANQTALQNVCLPLLYSRRFSITDVKRAEQALRLVGLEDRMHHYPNMLSGGQKQRVAIARAIVTEPLLLLADEPTGALDSKSSREVLDLFKKLHRSGRTIVVVTHEPEVAVQSQRLLMIRDGKLVADGPPRSVLTAYASIIGTASAGAE